jgi:hypothetical protein
MPIALRGDYDAEMVRAAARRSKDGTSRSARLRSQAESRDALRWHRRGRPRLWRHCAKRCGNKAGGPAEPSPS